MAKRNFRIFESEIVSASPNCPDDVDDSSKDQILKLGAMVITSTKKTDR